VNNASGTEVVKPPGQDSGESARSVARTSSTKPGEGANPSKWISVSKKVVFAEQMLQVAWS
jgi:hypothetical protein